MDYPRWSYCPRNVAPPSWVDGVLESVSAAKPVIGTEHDPTGLVSDEVLKTVSPGAEAMGFVVETGKKSHEKFKRPVFFGENGVPEIQYDHRQQSLDLP